MKKRQIDALGKLTPDYVIAHAKRQQQRNRHPSVAFRGERNPKKALALAKCLKDGSMTVYQVRERQWNVS
jgi:hypothetical protein